MASESSGGTSIYSFGWLVAVLLSWHLNHSIVWAIVHCLFSWLYVAYALCRWFL